MLNCRPYLSRRDMLLQARTRFGAIALSGLLSRDTALAAPLNPELRTLNPSARPPHVTPKAKSVIFLFMEGGPSHIDTFDPKPELDKLAGQKLPGTFKPVILPMG